MSGHASGKLSCSHGLHSGDNRDNLTETGGTGDSAHTPKHKAFLTSAHLVYCHMVPYNVLHYITALFLFIYITALYLLHEQWAIYYVCMNAQTQVQIQRTDLVGLQLLWPDHICS